VLKSGCEAPMLNFLTDGSLNPSRLSKYTRNYRPE
jgi:hypothetical protein